MLSTPIADGWYEAYVHTTKDGYLVNKVVTAEVRVIDNHIDLLRLSGVPYFEKVYAQEAIYKGASTFVKMIYEESKVFVDVYPVLGGEVVLNYDVQGLPIPIDLEKRNLSKGKFKAYTTDEEVSEENGLFVFIKQPEESHYTMINYLTENTGGIEYPENIERERKMTNILLTEGVYEFKVIKNNRSGNNKKLYQEAVIYIFPEKSIYWNFNKIEWE
ncbi:hypothetical protein [Algivirga pacifica]|uniref:Uncharacterized protein n=1 Tax=Algivirga pacifica TaxID=1162670 RepID=A0ABP9D930_9BACT